MRGTDAMTYLRLCLLLFIIPLTGCATSSAIHQARAEFHSGSPTLALNTLENADVSERDALLLLLDKGAVAFSAGRYELAKDSLLEANELLEKWDQIRVGEESASLITSEWAKRYRGEYSEQLWIHSYLMMTFLLQNNPEGAAVEARQALQRLDKHNDSLTMDWFTRALIALSFEAVGANDSAQVVYRKLASHPQYDGRWNNVIQRHSKSIGRDPIAGSQGSSYNATPTQLANDEGELIVFLQTGNIDRKIANNLAVDIDLHIAFPTYDHYYSGAPTYSVTANNEHAPADEIDTHLVDVSSRALAARGKALAAKQVARIVTKKAVVNLASSEDDIVGGVLQLLLFVTEQADTRSWETLPGWFSLLRVPLPTGQQEVSVTVRHNGRTHRVDLGEFNIQAKGMHFATFRTDLPSPVPSQLPARIPSQLPRGTQSNRLTGAKPVNDQSKINATSTVNLANPS